MCGVFGFALKQKMPIEKVFKVLERLEVHHYPEEDKPVGGYGAGLAVINDDYRVILEKTGKVCDISPVKHLSRIMRVRETNVLIGHVRMPSEKFMETAKFKETAQPYIAKCFSDLIVVSVHNGYVSNYIEIREKLCKKHLLESEEIGLIDSEVIPHLFEEKLVEKNGYAAALEFIFQSLEGSNTVCLLRIENEKLFTHFIHKGKTRGLNIWTNNQGEIVFCSRKEALTSKFEELLIKGEFREKISVRWREESKVKLSYRLRVKE
jgi:glucosamine 6-phosphate synthetase-like amidotransferase/phosphosugar isomerase protein